MINILQKSLSPQASKTYSLLLKHKELSATQIGKLMKIIRNSVYRNIKELAELGLVEAIQSVSNKIPDQARGGKY